MVEVSDKVASTKWGELAFGGATAHANGHQTPLLEEERVCADMESVRAENIGKRIAVRGFVVGLGHLEFDGSGFVQRTVLQGRPGMSAVVEIRELDAPLSVAGFPEMVSYEFDHATCTARMGLKRTYDRRGLVLCALRGELVGSVHLGENVEAEGTLGVEHDRTGGGPVLSTGFQYVLHVSCVKKVEKVEKPRVTDEVELLSAMRRRYSPREHAASDIASTKTIPAPRAATAEGEPAAVLGAEGPIPGRGSAGGTKLDGIGKFSNQMGRSGLKLKRRKNDGEMVRG